MLPRIWVTPPTNCLLSPVLSSKAVPLGGILVREWISQEVGRVIPSVGCCRGMRLSPGIRFGVVMRMFSTTKTAA